MNKIPAPNGVLLAKGVWAAPCNNDKVSFGNEGLYSQGRRKEEDRRTEEGGGGALRSLPSNITPSGNK